MSKSIIGYRYIPLDNSWCIDLNTKEEAHIVASMPFVNKNGYMFFNNITNSKDAPNSEPNSEFVIISEPYQMNAGSYHEKCNFINIRSINSNKEYRTLFYEQQIEE